MKVHNLRQGEGFINLTIRIYLSDN